MASPLKLSIVLMTSHNTDRITTGLKLSIVLMTSHNTDRIAAGLKLSIVLMMQSEGAPLGWSLSDSLRLFLPPQH
jgi:hypothetical protein